MPFIAVAYKPPKVVATEVDCAGRTPALLRLIFRTLPQIPLMRVLDLPSQGKMEESSVRASAARGGSVGGDASSSLGGKSTKHEQSEGASTHFVVHLFFHVCIKC